MYVQLNTVNGEKKNQKFYLNCMLAFLSNVIWFNFKLNLTNLKYGYLKMFDTTLFYLFSYSTKDLPFRNIFCLAGVDCIMLTVIHAHVPFHFADN